MPLNVGTVHGGSAINVVPDRCVVELGVRPLPGMASGSARRARAPGRRRRRRRRPLEPEIELLSDSPPMLLRRGRADPPRPLRPGRPGARERASPSPPTPAGSSGWAWTAPSSAPARSRWPTSPTSTCPRTELAAARGLPRADDPPLLRGGDGMSRAQISRPTGPGPASASRPASRCGSERTAASPSVGRLGDGIRTSACAAGRSCPGSSSAHSHAFQRGLRGRGERFPAGAGSFWTWREAMYGLVERARPGRASRPLPPGLPRDAGRRHHRRRRVPLSSITPEPEARDWAFDELVLARRGRSRHPDRPARGLLPHRRHRPAARGAAAPLRLPLARRLLGAGGPPGGPARPAHAEPRRLGPQRARREPGRPRRDLRRGAAARPAASTSTSRSSAARSRRPWPSYGRRPMELLLDDPGRRPRTSPPSTAPTRTRRTWSASSRPAAPSASAR